MNALFASTALGLVAAWPVSGLGWLLGKAADKLTGDPSPRAKTWNRAVALPPTVLGLMVSVSALPKDATDPVYHAAMASQTIASAGAAMNQASVRMMSGFNGVETAGAILILGALGGLAVAGVRQVMGRSKLKGIVARARPVPQELALAVRAAARRLDTGRPEVKVSDEIDQPLLAGLTTPVILLPTQMAARLDIHRLVPICAHELAHLKRGDNWRQVTEHLLGGLFWMVPPFASVRARAAAVREELADALALENAVPEVRRTYAETLVDVLRHRAAPALHPAFTGKGRKPTLMRLQAITDPRDPATFARKALLGLASLLVIALVAGGSIALAQQSDGVTSSSRTVINNGDKLYIDVTADSIKLDPASPPGGAATAQKGRVSVYTGDVRLRGHLAPGDALVLLNGQTPPKDFDPTMLGAGAIKRLEVTNYEGQRKPSVVLNVIM